MNPYAEDKALLHADRLATLRAGEQPNPVHLQMILSDLCNHDCHFCAYRMTAERSPDGKPYSSSELFGVTKEDGTYTHNPKRMLPTAKALEVLRDFAEMGGKAVQFTGGGEPTLHPDCGAIMHATNTLGLETALVTNGQAMGTNIRGALMRATWVRISIDAATAKTHATTRGIPESSFGKVLENVERLVSEKNQAKSSLYVGLGYVVTPENWQEIPAFVDIARDLGADNIRFAAAFQNLGSEYYKDTREKIQKLITESKVRRGGVSINDNFVERVADLDQGPPDYSTCAYQHLTTYVGADQNVYRCCVLAYNSRGKIGSIKGQRTFRDVWTSTMKRMDFANFDATKCKRCQFNGRNRNMLKIMGALPTGHANFV